MSASYTEQIQQMIGNKTVHFPYWGVYNKWKINYFISCYLKSEQLRMNSFPSLGSLGILEVQKGLKQYFNKPQDQSTSHSNNKKKQQKQPK